MWSHRIVATTIFSPPLQRSWQAHPTNILLGFSAALAPKFFSIIHFGYYFTIYCLGKFVLIDFGTCKEDEEKSRNVKKKTRNVKNYEGLLRNVVFGKLF